MKTFKAYIYKEYVESYKQSRYILLAVGLVLFALLDPILLKLLPQILSGQANIEMPENAISPAFALSNYIKDLHQIGFLFVIFSFAGTLLGEVKYQKLVFPLSKGARPNEIVLAKVAHYSLAVAAMMAVGLVLNYFYVWFLFGKPDLEMWKLVYPFVALNLYYWFYLSIALVLSSILKKTSTVGIIILLLSFFVGIIGPFIKAVKDFMPHNLVNSAYSYSFENAGWSVLIAIVLIVSMVYLSILRMNRIEVN